MCLCVLFDNFWTSFCRKFIFSVQVQLQKAQVVFNLFICQTHWVKVFRSRQQKSLNVGNPSFALAVVYSLQLKTAAFLCDIVRKVMCRIWHCPSVDRVSNFKHLRGGVVFVSEIPKTESGKILRRELRAKVMRLSSKLWDGWLSFCLYSSNEQNTLIFGSWSFFKKFVGKFYSLQCR